MTTAPARTSDRLHADGTTTGTMFPGGWGSGGAVEGAAWSDGTPRWIVQPDIGPDPRSYTASWHWQGSGAFPSADAADAWEGMAVQPAFPGVTTSPGIDLRTRVGLFARPPVEVLSTARQVRELQAALSVDKSELARILRVSRPTVYAWLDDGEPNAENVARILQVMRLLRGARASSDNPLFPRIVRLPPGPGEPALLDLLREETLDEAAITEALRRAKAMGDAIDREREQREARLRAAGFEEADAEEHKANLALNVALMDWPRE